MLKREGSLSRGEYKSCVNENENLVAVRYTDKKEKLLVSSFSTTLTGQPKIKVSRRTGLKVETPTPKIFSDFCMFAGAIDIYNHYTV